jgi:hypothetical protein
MRCANVELVESFITGEMGFPVGVPRPVPQAARSGMLQMIVH